MRIIDEIRKTIFVHGALLLLDISQEIADGIQRAVEFQGRSASARVPRGYGRCGDPTVRDCPLWKSGSWMAVCCHYSRILVCLARPVISVCRSKNGLPNEKYLEAEETHKARQLFNEFCGGLWVLKTPLYC